MPFLFHYFETSSFTNGALFAFGGTLLFIVLASLTSMKCKVYLIFLTNIIAVLLSVWLGGKFIIPPNESWFNPFGMNFAIIFVDVFILIGILIVRFISRTILFKVQK